MKNKGETFKGFMLQVRYDRERYDGNFLKGPVGYFTPNDSVKCMDCPIGGNKSDKGNCNR